VTTTADGYGPSDDDQVGEGYNSGLGPAGGLLEGGFGGGMGGGQPMTRPQRYLIRMVLVVVLVGGVVGLLVHELQDAFLANIVLNGMILGVLLLGTIYVFHQVFSLGPEVAWMEAYRRGQTATSTMRPKLLGPMATMLGGNGGRLSLSALAMRSLLDSISARLDEQRDISRYLIGLLVFLGLLGTFWGLLLTISSVGEAISGLDASGKEGQDVVTDLQQSLQAPLSGMGTAFSSSLFGLAGSLVLGFLELIAGQAQNRFYNELEEWLSSVTRLSATGLGGVGDTEQPVPAYLAALVEQTADSLHNLQYTLQRSEENRAAANAATRELVQKVGTLGEQMRAEQNLMVKLVESQMELKPVLSQLIDVANQGGFGADEATRAHIRNIDHLLARMTEDAEKGRVETVQQVRSEIKMLARTIAALAEEGDQ